MPITISDAPSTLPDAGKKLYVGAWNGAYKGTCKDRSDKDECASKIAWSAVKRKYKKSANDEWTPKADIQEFSMAITRTSYDKLTNTRHWVAVASDTEDDIRKDNMTLELFSNFLHRIETKEQPPEEFRSDFWSGGKPYLSISHYPDFNGEGVPGPVDSVYIDGRVSSSKRFSTEKGDIDAKAGSRGMLKAKGRFDDTPLGKACFQSISRDIEEKTPDDEKIRISIAFLDYMHRHKSTGYEFERTEDDGLCPECLKELITGEYGGMEFLRGHLIHLALTRVPVNQRTSMEVERSMATITKDEDATTVVGEEEAAKLEELEKEKAVGKSLVDNPKLVIKAEDEPVEKAKDKKKDEDDEEEEDDDKKKKKKEKKADIVEDSPFEEKALHLLSEIAERVTPKETPTHILDVRMDAVKEAYDQALEMEDSQLALQSVNEPFEELVKSVQEGLSKEVVKSEPTTQDSAVADALVAVTQQLAVMDAKLSALEANPQQAIANQIPERRSIDASVLLKQPQEQKKSETPGLQAKIREGMGLPPIG